MCYSHYGGVDVWNESWFHLKSSPQVHCKGWRGKGHSNENGTRICNLQESFIFSELRDELCCQLLLSAGFSGNESSNNMQRFPCGAPPYFVWFLLTSDPDCQDSHGLWFDLTPSSISRLFLSVQGNFRDDINSDWLTWTVNVEQNPSGRRIPEGTKSWKDDWRLLNWFNRIFSVYCQLGNCILACFSSLASSCVSH